MVELDQPAPKRRRISSSAVEMQATIGRPGSIEINVKGAYIIDQSMVVLLIQLVTTPGLVPIRLDS